MKKNQTIKTIAWAIVAGLTISFSACKKTEEDTTTTPVTPTKTLNKTTLTNNKKWSCTNPAITHAFFSNGIYGVDGTWAWVNNSDTMAIQYDAGDPKVKWKFNWNSDTEMECEWIGNGGSHLYKLTP